MASKARLIVMVIAIALAFVSWGSLLSLPPAFYPSVAESKGATPSQYGLVFGMVSLGGFIFSPIFALYGTKIGLKILCNMGGIVQGMAALAFGSLEFVNDTWTFIGLSYLLRFIDGVANAASSASIVSILMILFPGFESSIPAWTEVGFGLGYMIGPVLGSILFVVGTPGLPFYVMGGIILFFTLVLFLMVPNVKPGSSSKSKDLANGSKPCLTIRNVIQSFSLSLPFLDKFILFCGNGMLESMLQPHMINSEAQATQFEVSMAFLIMATCYVVICPIVGHVCDGMKRPILLSIVGNCFLVVAFIFIGPAPFITRLPTSVPLIFGMMPLFGLANGLVAVSSFSRAYKESIRQGYRDDVSTYLIVTGFWAGAFYLGNFIGPTVAGIIVNAIGFPQTSQISILVSLLMVILDCIQYSFQVKREKAPLGYENIS